MKVYAQSIPKLEEGEPNEDSCYLHPNGVCTLSDGAGGIGMFAKEWADTLTHQIARFTTLNQLIASIQQLQIHFYQQQEQFLEQHPDYFADKFFSEGSAATFLLADYSQPPTVHLLAYGDSGIFAYQKSKKTLVSNLSSTLLSRYPDLINCINPDLKPEKWYHQTLSLEPGDLILLASDAIAQYLRILYAIEHDENEFLQSLLNLRNAISAKIDLFQQQKQNLPSFEQALEECITALQSPKTFKTFCKDLYNRRLLDYDDYTLIILETDTPSTDCSASPFAPC